MAREEEKKVFQALVEGRLINGSLWEKDQYDQKSTPQYKVEIAVPAGGPADDLLWGALCEFAEDKWGDDGLKGLEEGVILHSLLVGDDLARKRERKGKKGDAYKGMTVVRAGTIFNHEGNDAPGGVLVMNEDAERIDILDKAQRSTVFNGCMVKVLLNVAHHADSDADRLKFYLQAVQKIGEGERLVSGPDYSTMFKPTGRRAGAAEGGGERRTRARGEEAPAAAEPARRARPAAEPAPVRRRAG